MTVFFFSKRLHKFCYNNDYSITAKTYLRHAIFYECSEIAIGNTKTNKKDKIGDQKNLLANFIFLKVVSNIRDAFGANHFTPEINITSAI